MRPSVSHNVVSVAIPPTKQEPLVIASRSRLWNRSSLEIYESYNWSSYELRYSFCRGVGGAVFARKTMEIMGVI